MAGWGSSRRNWRAGGLTPKEQGGSASGYSYLHHGAGTSNQNTNIQGGWNYGGEDWNFQYGKGLEQQWSTHADDEDWGFNPGRINPAPTGWSNNGSSRASVYQGNQGGWKSGAGDSFGTRGVNGKGFRGRERKRPRNSGNSDMRSGKRRQLERGRFGNIQDYNEYGNTGHDYSGWNNGSGGFWGANEGYGYPQGYDDWNQIPSRGSNWGAAGGGYYDEEQAYNYQFDFGGGHQRGYKKDQKRHRDRRRKAAPKKSEGKWRSKVDTSDDKLLNKKLSTLMQIKDERNGLANAVRNVMNAMTSASETLGQEAHQTSGEVPVANAEGDENGDKTEEPLPPQVLVGVIRVGPAIRKLLIKENLELGAELVAVFKNKPTKEQFRRLAILITQNLKGPFADKVSIVPDELVEKIIITVEASECPYPITISCTSPEYCSEVEASLDIKPEELLTKQASSDIKPEEVLTKQASSDIKPEELLTKQASSDIKPEELLTEEKCLEALTNIRRVRWSKQLRDDIELPIVRIFLDLASRLPGWKHLSPYPAEVLVHTVVKNLSKGVRESEMTVSRVFTQCVEILAEGLVLSGGPGLKDLCETDPTDVFAYLIPQAAEDLTNAAQTAVRLIACNKMKNLLQLGS